MNNHLVSLLRTTLSRPVSPGCPTLGAVVERLKQAGARPLLVGGWVRDALLGREASDVDVEVFGIDAERLETTLGDLVPLLLVGKAFAVYKVEGSPVEFSLPRRDSKVGEGHRGFSVEAVPDLSFAEAARRRDFTMNAMGVDPSSGELFDPFHGRDHLQAGILELVDEDLFADDPLRVLRAAQFLARFRLVPTHRLIAASRRIGAEGLAPERIWGELQKLLLGDEPSRGFEFLLASGWLRYLPELASLVGLPQDPWWHPEGDVWQHTLASLDAGSTLRTHDTRRDLMMMLGILCHDLGKITTTRWRDGRIRSIGHSEQGVALAGRFLTRLTEDRSLLAGVLKLVRWHLVPEFLRAQGAGLGAVRRLARRLAPEADIALLERCARADFRGSHGPDAPFPAGDWLLHQAEEAGVEARPEPPALLGRHLLEAGVSPGPRMGSLLRRAYELQIQEGIRDPLVLRDRVMREAIEEASPQEPPWQGMEEALGR